MMNLTTSHISRVNHIKSNGDVIVTVSYNGSVLPSVGIKRKVFNEIMSEGSIQGSLSSLNTYPISYIFNSKKE